MNEADTSVQHLLGDAASDSNYSINQSARDLSMLNNQVTQKSAFCYKLQLK